MRTAGSQAPLSKEHLRWTPWPRWAEPPISVSAGPQLGARHALGLPSARYARTPGAQSAAPAVDAEAQGEQEAGPAGDEQSATLPVAELRRALRDERVLLGHECIATAVHSDDDLGAPARERVGHGAGVTHRHGDRGGRSAAVAHAEDEQIALAAIPRADRAGERVGASPPPRCEVGRASAPRSRH